MLKDHSNKQVFDFLIFLKASSAIVLSRLTLSEGN